MSPMKKSRIFILLAIVLTSAIVGVYYYSTSMQQAKPTLTVGYLYTFSHIVGLTMKDRGVLNEYLPDWAIEYKKFASGDALRESMIAGTVDIGFVGFEPFLTGLDKNVEWKIAMATAKCTSPHIYTLVTSNDNVQTLRDLKGKKVNLLSPSSVLHTLMDMVCKLWPEANLTMEDITPVWVTHPNALSLILTHDIDAAFFVAPYNYMAIEAGCRVLVDVGDIRERLGSDISMTLVAVMEKFHREHFDAYTKFLKAYSETSRWIQTHPNETVDIAIAGEYFKGVRDDIIRTCLKDLINSLDLIPHNVIDVANKWMYENGYISKVYTREEVFYDEVLLMGAN